MNQVSGELINVLDIDLDTFLDRVEYGDRGGRRLNKKHFRPWPEGPLRNFLESRCGLSNKRRIPGIFVKQHHDALPYFESLFQKSGPLHVTHVDAHADLGMGGPSWKYIITEYLKPPPGNRVFPYNGPYGINEGNYLAYALASQMVARLTYVHNPASRDDCVALFFRDNDLNSGFVEMKLYPPAIVARALDRMESPDPKDAVAKEPPIPFTRVSTASFRSSESFNAAVLCQSPGYTPTTSDALIPVFAEYINFEPPLPTSFSA
jgi:hypothetical protein